MLLALALAQGCPTGDDATPDDDADDDTADDDTADDDTGDDDTADDDAGDDDTDPPAVRLMLHGGGAEEDEVYERFVAAAGYGHIVTLGAVPDPGTYPDLLFWDGYFVELGAASAETINTESADDAEDAAVVAALDAADGVYVRGGDQSRYLEHWEDTALHAALAEAWDRGAVVGGSSAGCAILGERIYDARVGGVAAWEALLDPYDPTITFSDDLLGALPRVITDTHFTERGRLGRLAVFLERWKLDGAANPLGIGVDPMTALFVSSDGTAEVVGRGAVTVIETSDSQATLTAGEPPDIRTQRVWQLPSGYRVLIPAFGTCTSPVLERPAYVAPTQGWQALPGDFTAVALDGDDLDQRALGDWQLGGLDDSPYGWIDGELTLEPGDGTLPGTLLVTGLYEDSDFFENHLGGMIWALAQHPELAAIGLDIYLDASAEPPATLAAAADSYLLVIDARTAGWSGVPAGGWQTAGLEGATLSVIGPGQAWDGDASP